MIILDRGNTFLKRFWRALFQMYDGYRVIMRKHNRMQMLGIAGSPMEVATLTTGPLQSYVNHTHPRGPPRPSGFINVTNQVQSTRNRCLKIDGPLKRNQHGSRIDCCLIIDYGSVNVSAFRTAYISLYW